MELKRRQINPKTGLGVVTRVNTNISLSIKLGRSERTNEFPCDDTSVTLYKTDEHTSYNIKYKIKNKTDNVRIV
jgi:hypothetical protein